MARFEQRVALVTGAASGIGRATALKLAAEGANLTIADLNAEGLAEVAQLCREQGSDVLEQVFDVTSMPACKAAVDATVEKFGKLDLLCNIAGIAQCKHFTDVTEADVQLMLSVNLASVIYLSNAAMPALIESKGNIVNLASSAGLAGQAYTSLYCATKAAVINLSRSLATEFAAKGVRVNALCPGSVITPLTTSFKVPEGIDPALFSKMYPLLEAAQPEEIAEAVAYLASDDARFVTGVAFAIDGGQTAC